MQLVYLQILYAFVGDSHHINENTKITIAMKSIYTTPQTEKIELRTEGNILTISNGVISSSLISAEAMTEDSSTFDAWD